MLECLVVSLMVLFGSFPSWGAAFICVNLAGKQVATTEEPKNTPETGFVSQAERTKWLDTLKDEAAKKYGVMPSYRVVEQFFLYHDFFQKITAGIIPESQALLTYIIMQREGLFHNLDRFNWNAAAQDEAVTHQHFNTFLTVGLDTFYIRQAELVKRGCLKANEVIKRETLPTEDNGAGGHYPAVILTGRELAIAFRATLTCSKSDLDKHWTGEKPDEFSEIGWIHYFQDHPAAFPQIQAELGPTGLLRKESEPILNSPGRYPPSKKQLENAKNSKDGKAYGNVKMVDTAKQDATSSLVISELSKYKIPTNKCGASLLTPKPQPASQAEVKPAVNTDSIPATQ